MDELDQLLIGQSLEGSWVVQEPRHVQRDAPSASRAYLASNRTSNPRTSWLWRINRQKSAISAGLTRIHGCKQLQSSNANIVATGDRSIQASLDARA